MRPSLVMDSEVPEALALGEQCPHESAQLSVGATPTLPPPEAVSAAAWLGSSPSA